MRTAFLSVLMVLSLSEATLAQSTAFTYQGRLTSAGSPAAGLHDLRFRLYNAASGGVQVGSMICLDNVSVTNGLFASTLDFGQQFATAEPRYLEIDVRKDTGLGCSGSTGYTTLTPRQLITNAPHASVADAAHTLASPNGALLNAVFVDNSGNVGVGTTSPQAKLMVNSGDIVAGLPTNGWFFHTRSSFNGDFMHITDTLAGTPQFQHGLVLTKAGNVGIGVTAPQAALHVNGSIKVSPATRWKSVHGSAFQPQHFDDASFGTQGGLSIVESFGTGNCGTVGDVSSLGPAMYFAPLELPDGATLDDLVLDARDLHPTEEMTLSIGKTNLITGLVTEIATTFTSGASSAIQHPGHGPIGEVIDNSNNVYFLRMIMASNGTNIHLLLAARVKYSVTAPLP